MSKILVLIAALMLAAITLPAQMQSPIQLEFCCPGDTTPDAGGFMKIYTDVESIICLGPYHTVLETKHPHPIGEYETIFFISNDCTSVGIPLWYVYCVINAQSIEAYEYHQPGMILYDGGDPGQIFQYPRPETCQLLADFCRF